MGVGSREKGEGRKCGGHVYTLLSIRRLLGVCRFYPDTQAAGLPDAVSISVF